MKSEYKILIVEDDEGLQLLIKSVLERNGFHSEGVKLGESAIKYAIDNQPVLMILDYKLPDISAIDIITELKAKDIDVFFIIITGHTKVKTAVEMMKLGVKDYIIKDSNFLELISTVVIRVFEDIEKEKKLSEAEEALRESEKKYKLLAESIVDVIWMTDIDLNLEYISDSVYKLIGYKPEELIGKNIETILSGKSKDMVINYFKRILNGFGELNTPANGFHIKNDTIEMEQLCKDKSRVWTEVRISFAYDIENKVSGILGVSREITGRKEAVKRLNDSFKTLRRALEASIEAMGKATEIRDPYTAGHQKRVSILAFAIAKEMGLSEDQCEGVRLAGAIHDIGKIYVPAEILSKPGKISENEFNIIKTHAQVGYDILRTIDFPWPIAKIVLQHHERLDGSGYPNGLTENDILVEAKIICVADVVEAMASHRPYRPAKGPNEALMEIRQYKGQKYDARVVDICCKLIEEEGFKFDF